MGTPLSASLPAGGEREDECALECLLTHRRGALQLSAREDFCPAPNPAVDPALGLTRTAREIRVVAGWWP